MAKITNEYYFDNLRQSAHCACDAAAYLVECFSNFNANNLFDMLNKMHEFEHSGDIKKHEMNEALAKAFVTPVDREDIALISQNIDDVTDTIEEVLQRFYMYKISTVIPEAVEFSKKIAECCNRMETMLYEFNNFKKPAKLHELIIDINHMEEECDRLYIESIRNLDSHFSDTLEIISWRKIFDKLEACADTCEHVGDCVDMVVMKNS